MTRKVALITGGTRGLGRAVSLRLAASGFIPAMTYRADAEAASEALELVQKTQADARTYACDLADADSVGETVEAVVRDLGRVDVLVNNAYQSTGAPAKTHELAVETWSGSLEANLTGPFLVSRAVLWHMVERGSGRIVFVGSLAARGEPGRLAYTVAKNGQLGLMKTIAREYAKLGITCNTVAPGYMDAGAFLRLDEEVRERAAKSVPMKRLGRAEEVAEAVAYFCSEAAGYTTGQVLGVDGGAT